MAGPHAARALGLGQEVTRRRRRAKTVRPGRGATKDGSAAVAGHCQAACGTCVIPTVMLIGTRRALTGLLIGLTMSGCGEIADTSVDATPEPELPVDGPAPTLGTRQNPAASCGELRGQVGPTSGVYWLHHADPQSPALQVYCEQVLNGGGWALLVNSVLTETGETLAFWQIPYLERFGKRGTAAPDQNYYQGELYLIGRELMDTITDVAGKTVVAAVVTTTGINSNTMKLGEPVLMEGNAAVFDNHFNAGWSSTDFDGDPYGSNCATQYGGVTQHYGACWVYSLGADADAPFEDGGVGPHVHAPTLAALQLAPQPGGGQYSRVNRIARFTRW